MVGDSSVTKEEEAMIQYCRDRLGLYIMLEKKYGHEKACKILSLYDLRVKRKVFKPELTTLEAYRPPSPKGRAEREQERVNWRNILEC